MPAENAVAFAPGRVNLIGEHTDYNGGLALPFAVARGVRVEARALQAAQSGEPPRVQVEALDFGEHDEFSLSAPAPASGWRAFARGAVAELSAAGWRLRPARLRIAGDVPRGAGLSSSAALEVALCLALTALAEDATRGPELGVGEKIELARLCARIENDWVGAQTGLLDQLASLFGREHAAVLIDFCSLAIEPVLMPLDGWRLVVLDSGQHHTNESSGYNARRAECDRACELLGVTRLSEADRQAAALLPDPLCRRALHVLDEDERVRATVDALSLGDLALVGRLLNAAHASLRDLFEVSTPAVESTRARLLDAGAAGARIMGGGFGGGVLGLFAPEATPPRQAFEVGPGPGAHLLDAQ